MNAQMRSNRSLERVSSNVWIWRLPKPASSSSETEADHALSISPKNFNRARQEFEEALNKSVNKYLVLEYIVKSYLAEGVPEQAIERVNARLEKNPDDAISHQLLGYIYLNKKRAKKNNELCSHCEEKDKIPDCSGYQIYSDREKIFFAQAAQGGIHDPFALPPDQLDEWFCFFSTILFSGKSSHREKKERETVYWSLITIVPPI